MENFTDFIADKNTMLLNKYGAFFAFSQDQFEKSREAGVEYISAHGLVVPKTKAKSYFDERNSMTIKAKEEYLKVYDLKDIIRYELFNYEAFYTYSIEDSLEALEFFGANKEQVQKVFKIVAKEQEKKEEIEDIKKAMFDFAPTRSEAEQAFESYINELYSDPIEVAGLTLDPYNVLKNSAPGDYELGLSDFICDSNNNHYWSGYKELKDDLELLEDELLDAQEVFEELEL